MFKLLLAPLIAGILVFLLFYFISPEFLSESELVSLVAQFTLNLSNAVFEHMPPIVAKYIAALDLTIVSITAAVLTTGFVQLLVIICSAIYYPLRWLVLLAKRKPVSEVVRDLPAITPDAQFFRADTGKKILGRGFDTVEND